MAGWDYIIGETGYDQPFVMFKKSDRLAYNGTGISAATMSIVNSDLTDVSPPISNIVLTVNTADPLRVLLAVLSSGSITVPQTKGSYLVIFTVTISGTEIRKTFELDLRVFRG